MSQLSYPPVQQALARLKTLSADEEAKERARVRDRALRDELTQVAMAEIRGKLEGKLEGLQEGLQNALAKMRASGIPEAQVPQGQSDGFDASLAATGSGGLKIRRFRLQPAPSLRKSLSKRD